MGAALLVAENIVALLVAVAKIEVLGGGGHVDEGHVELLCHEFHLVHVVHGVVRGGHLLIAEHAVGSELLELVAQVVLSGAADGVA